MLGGGILLASRESRWSSTIMLKERTENGMANFGIGTSARPEHAEGEIARGIEEQTAKLPSVLFLWAAIASMGFSLALQIGGAQKLSNFVGQWAPTILILGLYNKMVKVAGSDQYSSGMLH